MTNNKTIFLATDDLTLVNKLKKTFPDKKFLDSGSLRVTTSDLNLPIDFAILDLFLLASCSEVHLVPLDFEATGFPKFSGYGRLAKHIWIVNKIQRKGIIKWLSTQNRLTGAAGFERHWMNFIYLAVYELPRIFAQAYRPRGIYKQLSEMLGK